MRGSLRFQDIWLWWILWRRFGRPWGVASVLMHLQSWVHSQLAWRSCFNVCLVGLPLLLQAMCFANPPTRNTHRLPWCFPKCSLAPTKMSLRCCTGWCESPVASVPLPLLESGDLLCGCSVLQPRGGDGCWTMLNGCRSLQHATPNHAKHPSTDKSWQRHLEASARDLAIAEDSGNGSLRGQVKHDRSRGQERSEIAMAVSCFNVDNFLSIFQR